MWSYVSDSGILLGGVGSKPQGVKSRWGVGEGQCHLVCVWGVDGGLAQGKEAGRDKQVDSINSAEVMECDEGLTWDGEREGSPMSGV